MSKRQIIKAVIRIMKDTDNMTVLRDMYALVQKVDYHYKRGAWTV